ncbi:thioredoxin-like domain-containing protein [Ferruginibacter sp. SUN106]|uniref:thioredoxin-like domain-containing protein n=1 Tax=Ferruginibacter sp. SUN106 TaxID=2978348 RepID=UPI003D361636
MKKLIIAALCSIASCTVSSQNNFTISGTIERLSKSRSVILSSRAGQFIAPVDSAGKFEIKGTVDEVGFALIKTDSSGADGLWLEPGEYTIHCKEITREGVKGYLFRMPGFKGPQDATINYGFNQPRYYIKGDAVGETMLKQKNFAMHYIDSIFQYFPTSKTLPEMIRLSQTFIGDEAVLAYQALLSTDQKNDSNSKQLENYFKRKEKIKTDIFFDNFTMKNNKGKKITLSSVTGKKLLLIDFWSSDCSPCRSKHKKLVELYQKYAGKGLEIISVSLDNNNKAWQTAIKNDKMTWINVSDLKGWNNSLAKSYYVQSIPFALWLDGNRKILGAELSEKEIEKYLE